MKGSEKIAKSYKKPMEPERKVKIDLKGVKVNTGKYLQSIKVL